MVKPKEIKLEVKPTMAKTSPKATPKIPMVDIEGLIGEPFQDGDIVALDEILNQPLTITSFDRRDGLYGPFYTIHIDDEGQIVNCGGETVMKALDRIEHALPVKDLVFVAKPLANNKRMYGIVTKGQFLQMEQGALIQA
jgi:hypothetical protein